MKPSGKTQQPPCVRSLRAPPRGAPSPAVVVFRGPEEPRACPGRQPSNFPRIGHPASLRGPAWEAPGRPLPGKPLPERPALGGPCLGGPGRPYRGLFGGPCLPAWEAPEAPAWEALPGPCLEGPALPGKPLPGNPPGRPLSGLFKSFSKGPSKGHRTPATFSYFGSNLVLGDPPCSKLRPPLKGKVCPQKHPK